MSSAYKRSNVELNFFSRSEKKRTMKRIQNGSALPAVIFWFGHRPTLSSQRDLFESSPYTTHFQRYSGPLGSECLPGIIRLISLTHHLAADKVQPVLTQQTTRMERGGRLSRCPQPPLCLYYSETVPARLSDSRCLVSGQHLR